MPPPITTILPGVSVRAERVRNREECWMFERGWEGTGLKVWAGLLKKPLATTSRSKVRDVS